MTGVQTCALPISSPPTLSEGYAWPLRGPWRESEHARLGSLSLSLSLSLSRGLVGEGWGEGGSSQHSLWLKLLANQEALCPRAESRNFTYCFAINYFRESISIKG